MIGRDQGVEVNHLPGRLVTPRHLHPRGPRTDRALRGRLLRKLLEQIRSRHRRLSTSNAIAGNQISVETATGKNSHPLRVEWSGTGRSSPISSRIEPTSPSVWRSARSNTTRRVKDVSIVRGE